MYTKRVQIVNYGPISHLDITLPFDGENPKPVLLVGENGSGKSIFLSHIVNGLVIAKDRIYPETPEVEVDKVFKIRSPQYIRSENEYYFVRVEFEKDLYTEEISFQSYRRQYSDEFAEQLHENAKKAWANIAPNSNTYMNAIELRNNDRIRDIVLKNCILYFPHNRFEEAAWLNEENLKSKAQYMNIKHIRGYTNRKVINYSSLQDNQNWIFELLYDSSVFEIQTESLRLLNRNDESQVTNIDRFKGFEGNATSIYNIVLKIIRSIVGRNNVKFNFGERDNRRVALMIDDPDPIQLVPNIFQLSSGETSLLNIFLSILRDYDLSDSSFSNSTEVRGIALIDEIDLHLHSNHQYEVLPKLVKMFPKVQFIITTHSPLFLLGMQREFGDDGFDIYRLPQGLQISAEEFGEFGIAYQAFTETNRFMTEIRTAIKSSQRPIVYLEGKTDVKYIKRASELLHKKGLMESVKLLSGEGKGNLDNIWKSFRQTPDVLRSKAVLIYDCDSPKPIESHNNPSRINIPYQKNHPIQKGIENLFDRETLQRAKKDKPAFIDIEKEHSKTKRGQQIHVPESWTVNQDEKTNLCNWICENGTTEDFKHFNVLFDLLKETLDPPPVDHDNQDE